MLIISNYISFYLLFRAGEANRADKVILIPTDQLNILKLLHVKGLKFKPCFG
jgi:hypothetical protein